ncbi:hypothetical protein V511_12215 [Mesotoga sp. Brook.08.YT.4.2.5.1]|uniref:hypothetical protein n=1 Tax=unclassified Mesotoga TaxID=1184398 RepID=UPI000C18681D|nr:MULTISPECIES: hypothetical protein [unclassified Mesotoga]PNE19882.1 hypothetical protein V511_12215 [Mesotoga sp. Brook.08.YT.4.2.5.1]PVD18217.1 hypothetical protein V512_015230 [Mesotoga sp. Brook.08.105.5.1]RAO96548.1 hypothetical protein M388_14210 [Mesotoga sp. Brook.08.YT.4.2.5.4.]RDI93695.1 hypothetical protein Q502_04395 [Mesotoga sp. Brook.08.YT.4.2.5.2.]
MAVLETITSFARKNKINPRLIHALVERYRIEPDAVHEKVKFYQPDRLRELVNKVDSVMRVMK